MAQMLFFLLFYQTMLSQPFRCNEPGCDYASGHASDLKSHQRKHTGEKPYECDEPGCDYASGHAGNLKAHQRRRYHGAKNSTSDGEAGWESRPSGFVEIWRHQQAVVVNPSPSSAMTQTVTSLVVEPVVEPVVCSTSCASVDRFGLWQEKRSGYKMREDEKRLGMWELG